MPTLKIDGEVVECEEFEIVRGTNFYRISEDMPYVREEHGYAWDDDYRYTSERTGPRPVKE